MAGCPSDTIWIALAEGRLPAEDAPSLHAHLDSCPPCRALLAALVGSQQQQQQQDGQAAPPAEFDQYRLIRPLGQGAMGTVYLAHDTLLHRPVAVKFIRTLAPAARERFLVEARAIARLTHPNVVAVHRVGEADGRPFLVSEYLPGPSLDLVARPLPAAQALRIAVGLARGLAAAHLRGVLHRDIKPANAMLAADGEAKLVDFGLAKLLDAPAGLAQDGGAGPSPGAGPGTEIEGAAQTAAGTVIGTPRYMAPEGLRGEPATCAGDVYSLGALLYELCAGHPPHPETGIAALVQAVTGSDAPPLLAAAPAADPRLAAIIDRCLRRDPQGRFPSGVELAAALGPLLHAAPPEGNPYRGLLPFEEHHRALFFGRDAQIREIAELLRGEPAVVVIGDSGVGKSSLCQAGVLPLVTGGGLGEGRRWRARRLRPGRAPLAALAQALVSWQGQAEEEAALLRRLRADPAAAEGLPRLQEGEGAVLFIDQMEELITQSEPEEAAAAAAILGRLSARRAGLRLLLCARGDFLTRLAELPGLAAPLTRGLYLLRALPEEGLREAVLGPARRAGLRFESAEGVEELVASTARSRGGLPLLQFALAELWEARDPRRAVIPAAAISAIGGVAGALSRHADGVLARLPPAQREAARRLLVRLVTREQTRARRALPELLTAQERDERAALDALVRGRLLVVREEDGAPLYEIAHEALIQGWGALRGWLNRDAERQALAERLGAAAAEWERLGCGADLLLREAQLREAAALREEDLPPLPGAFLRASRRAAARGRLLRRSAVAAGALGLLLLTAGPLRQRDELLPSAEEIALVTLAAEARQLARRPGHERDALQAALRSAGAHLDLRRRGGQQALLAIEAALAAARRSWPCCAFTRLHALAPDGAHLLVSSGAVPRRWAPLGIDGLSGAAARPLPWTGEAPTDASFAPGGLLAAAGADGVVRLFDERGGPPAALRGHAAAVHLVALSPDGRRLLSAGQDRAARLWDVTGRRPIADLPAPGAPGPLSFAHFSADGRRVIASAGETAWTYAASDGRPLAALTGHTGGLLAVRLSPDGERAVTAGQDRSARVWDARSGAPLHTLVGHDGAVRAVAFTPDGAAVLSASSDQTARLHPLTAGAAPLTLRGHERPLTAALVSPDGALLLTAGEDGTARRWRRADGRAVDVLSGHWGGIRRAAFSGDGAWILTVGEDGVARRWDALLPEGPIAPELAPLFAVSGAPPARAGLATAPGGARAAALGEDGLVRIWRAGEGALLIGHAAPVLMSVFSPDGALLVTAAADRTARVWDAGTGLLLAIYAGEFTAAAFTPDGRRIVLYQRDGALRLHPAPVRADAALAAACALIGGGPPACWDA